MSNPDLLSIHNNEHVHTSIRPYIADCPKVYEPNRLLIEAMNKGELVTEVQAFEAYFTKLDQEDPEYMQELRRIVDNRRHTKDVDEAEILERRMQFVVPAYREGENMPHFLNQLKDQFEQSPNLEWGVTIVMDYAIPERNPNEEAELQRMENIIKEFLEAYPEYAKHIDHISYTRNKNAETPVLPIGLARKIGADVLMYERLAAHNTTDLQDSKPLHIGLMDMDTGNMTPGLLYEMASMTAETEAQPARCIKAKGSFNREDKQENLHLYPLEMMWEGPLSAVALQTKYNPFTIGRLSAVPARELAVTGGGFPNKRPFPDEDIRNGIQISTQLTGIEHYEATGKYSTSARREIGTMNGVRALVQENGGLFTQEAMEVAALIRMYGNWANQAYRKELGNVLSGETDHQGNPLYDQEAFNREVPPELIEVMTNAGYRFTAFAMFAIDELIQNPHAVEVHQLVQEMLDGYKAHFEVELQTLDEIRRIATTDPEKFELLKPSLAAADAKSRSAIQQILSECRINFTLQETGPIYGLLEEPEPGQDRDKTVLQSPFKIAQDQSGYQAYIRQDLGLE